MMLDLDAVGKGYATDEVAEILQEAGVTSALLNLGGNIVAIGYRPDGSNCNLGIRSPFENEMLGMLSVSNCSVVTSGNYENNFIGEDNIVYGHIIDPKTGYPVNNDLASVTIVSKEGKSCDALSTSLFVMGKNAAIDYWKKHPDFEMILVTQDKSIFLTKGLESDFTLDKSYSDMNVQVLEK